MLNKIHFDSSSPKCMSLMVHSQKLQLAMTCASFDLELITDGLLVISFKTRRWRFKYKVITVNFLPRNKIVQFKQKRLKMCNGRVVD